jgi:hypothetical protein
MKNTLLTLMVFGSFGVFAEDVIDIMCEYVQDSEIAGWKVGGGNKSATFDFKDEAVIFKIDLSRSTMLINDSVWEYTAWLNGSEIGFTTKVGILNGVLQEYDKLFRHYDQGTINRETGEMKMENYTEQNKGEEDFKLGFSRKYKCRSYKFKF